MCQVWSQEDERSVQAIQIHNGVSAKFPPKNNHPLCANSAKELHICHLNMWVTLLYLPWTVVIFSIPPGKTTTRERSLSMRFSFWSMVKWGFPGYHWEKPGESRSFSPGGDGALLLVDTLHSGKERVNYSHFLQNFMAQAHSLSFKMTGYGFPLVCMCVFVFPKCFLLLQTITWLKIKSAPDSMKGILFPSLRF